MQSFETGLGNFIARLKPEEAKKMEVHLNNVKFAEAVQAVFAKKQGIANSILAHVSVIYFLKDETPRKGKDKDKTVVNCVVVLNDAQSRSELDCHREYLAFEMRRRGLHFDQIILKQATLDMRKKFLYPHIREKFLNQKNSRLTDDNQAVLEPVSFREIEHLAGKIENERISEKFKEAMDCSVGEHAITYLSGDGQARPKSTSRAIYDESKLLTTFKRAICLAFGNIEHAEAFLERIEGASLEEVKFNERNKRSYRNYWCYLYVRDYQQMKEITKVYGDAIKKRTADLGLYINAISIRPSFDLIKNQKAFPEEGDPIPLSAYNLNHPD